MRLPRLIHRGKLPLDRVSNGEQLMKISGYCGGLAVLLASIVSSGALAETCITEIGVRASDASYPPAPIYGDKQLGHWDVGGAGAQGSDGSSGYYMAGMSAKTGAISDGGCIEDVQLRVSDDPNGLTAPAGYQQVATWDPDNGGARGTDGSTGAYIVGLYTKRQSPSSTRVVTDLFLTATDGAGASRIEPGFASIGHWDVEGGGGQGTNRSEGSYMMTMQAKSSPVTPAAAQSAAFPCITDLVLTASDGAEVDPGRFPGYRLEGYWDVAGNARGGALRDLHAAAAGGTSGNWNMGLYVQEGMVTEFEDCVGGVFLEVSDSANPPTAPQGYKRLGFWDVDGGGAVGTDGSTGAFMMSLSALPAALDQETRLKSLRLLASNDDDLSGKGIEEGGNKHFFNAQWDVDAGGAVGAQGSQGSYMLALLTAGGASPPKTVFTAEGKWVSACSGGQNCELVLKKSFGTQRGDTVQVSQEIKFGISQTVKGGVTVPGLADASQETTTSFESKTSAAYELATTREVGFEETCQLSFDLVKYNIHTVWQWQVSVDTDLDTFVIKTCETACTATPQTPGFLPTFGYEDSTCTSLRP